MQKQDDDEEDKKYSSETSSSSLQWYKVMNVAFCLELKCAKM